MFDLFYLTKQGVKHVSEVNFMNLIFKIYVSIKNWYPKKHDEIVSSSLFLPYEGNIHNPYYPEKCLYILAY